MANNRTCICCGKSFYYCTSCNASSRNTGISMNYDTHECAELVNAISGYSMKMWDKSKIKEVLNKYNVTDYSKYKQSIQDKLNELFPKYERGIRAKLNFYEEVPAETIDISIETKETQDTNEATTEQKENEIPEEVKPQRKRKSRKKKIVLSDETESVQSDDGDNL